MVKTNKKSLLTAMFILLFSAILLVGGLSIGSSKPQVDTKVNAASSTELRNEWLTYAGDFCTAKNIIFTNKVDRVPGEYISATDISEAQNNSLTAYLINNANGGKDCIIYGEDVIYAPSNFTFYSSLHPLQNLETVTFESMDFSNTTKIDFSECSVLKSVDFSGATGFDNGSLTSTNKMFYSCMSLETITLPAKFDTSKVTDMSSMFEGCVSLKKIQFPAGFVTNNVLNMANMFRSCVSLTSVNINGFNTAKVTDMSCMFAGCGLLGNLNLSNFDTNSVENFEGMFLISTWAKCADMFELNMDSETFYHDVATCFGLSPQEDASPEEVKKSLATLGGICDKGLNSVNLSSFVISSNANVSIMFADSELPITELPKIIYAPADCNKEIELLSNMYLENSETAYSVLKEETNGLTLVADANKSAKDYNSSNVGPAAGFDMNEIILTTTLGMALLVAIAIVYTNTKKKYIKR